MVRRTATGVALIVVLAACTVPHGPQARASDPPNLRLVQAATFEVLAPIAGAGSPGVVGTAFAIGPNRFVSAAHTFDQIIGSRFSPPILMDSNRRGYELADVLQYSQQEDYIVFSLRRPPALSPLEIRADRDQEPIVYFAGRRSGGGIVITRGVFSGSSVEEAGGFEWLRFRSRIWPGVSGGPLLDSQGEVIGIVRARARDDDTNYAVPISLIARDASDRARLHSRELLRPLGNALAPDTLFQGEVSLPRSYDSFAQEVVRRRAAYFDQTVGRTLERTRDGFILRGRGADSLCTFLNGEECHCKALRDVKGVLIVDKPTANADVRRAEDGATVIQLITGVTVLRASDPQRNDEGNGDAAAATLAHLKLALRREKDLEVGLAAKVARARIEAAELDMTYQDYRDRSWRLLVWPLADEDMKIVSLRRKLANGSVVLMRVVPGATTYAALLQIKFVANLTYGSCQETDAELSTADGTDSILRRGQQRFR